LTLIAVGIVAVGALILVDDERGGRSTASGRAERATPPRADPVAAVQIATKRRLVCTLPRGAAKLPARSRRGLIDHLLQYPVVTLATPRQRRAAEHVLAELVSASRRGRWSDLRAVERAGYETRTAPRKPGDRSIHYFHAERRQEPRGAVILDPRRPKALIYANAPDHPLVLVGAMWSMRRGELGPTPAGPIMRWHSHIICSDGVRRGTKPPAGGRCPPGTELRQGRSEMLHVWFTRDLRSAFAIRAPQPELCTARLLPRDFCKQLPRAEALDGRASADTEDHPAVAAAFARESYRPGDAAQLSVSNRAGGIRMRIYRSGPERRITRGDLTMNGVPVTPTRFVGSSTGARTVLVRVGAWPSGLYFARLRSADGRVGFAPFVVRPRRLGEHRVAVVLPTLTWQAYNRRDEDGDGVGDTWYADWKRKSVRLGRPHLSRGVPYNFRRYDLPFLHWLARTGKKVDVLSQSDLESAPGARALASAYDLIVFPGHHEYVTSREYDLVEGYRDRGGNLAFLSANNFYWRVVRHGDLLTKTKRWRDLGRPEAALIGVQYRANGRAPHPPWIVRAPDGATPWLFAGTSLTAGSEFARGGVEIDGTVAASPRNVQVVAEIPDLFGPGLTAQMTYYETAQGAQVFAAGAFYLTRQVLVDPVVSRLLGNLWARLARD
jgi:hypothetical protein